MAAGESSDKKPKWLEKALASGNPVPTNNVRFLELPSEVRIQVVRYNVQVSRVRAKERAKAVFGSPTAP